MAKCSLGRFILRFFDPVNSDFAW